MSYGVAVALQTAILERLEADAALSVPVFDAPPVGVPLCRSAPKRCAGGPMAAVGGPSTG